MSITTATEKLQKEKAKASNKYLAVPIIDYLIKRVSESEAFAEDVDQAHKTWANCEKYVTEKAKEKLQSKNGALPKEMVFEWAEDYYHLDDKAKAEKEAKEKAEREATRKKQLEERKASAGKKPEVKVTKSYEKGSKITENAQNNTVNAQKAAENAYQKPKASEKNQIEGQMDFTSFFGI